MVGTKAFEHEWERGMTLPEILAVLAVLAILGMVSVGVAGRIIEQASGRSLVTTFRALVAGANTRAIQEGRYIGIVFEDGPQGASGRLYRDGDGDGILREDIRKGVDRPLGSAVVLRAERAFVGIPKGVDVDPMGKPLEGADAIRFGRGDILSFSPHALATPGTLYLKEADGLEGWAFRVAGIDGRVRVFRWFNEKWERWE
jgi:prepilin-type N-terminal cleavage/methylation domain-containing protein